MFRGKPIPTAQEEWEAHIARTVCVPVVNDSGETYRVTRVPLSKVVQALVEQLGVVLVQVPEVSELRITKPANRSKK